VKVGDEQLQIDLLFLATQGQFLRAGELDVGPSASLKRGEPEFETCTTVPTTVNGFVASIACLVALLEANRRLVEGKSLDSTRRASLWPGLNFLFEFFVSLSSVSIPD